MPNSGYISCLSADKKKTYPKFLSQGNTTFQLPNFQEVSMLSLLLKAKVQEQDSQP